MLSHIFKFTQRHLLIESFQLRLLTVQVVAAWLILSMKASDSGRSSPALAAVPAARATSASITTFHMVSAGEGSEGSEAPSNINFTLS